jgi:hypothetical protein
MNNRTTIENPYCDTCGVALHDRWDYKGQRKDHFPDCPRRYEKSIVEKPSQNDQEEKLKRNHQNLVRFLGFMALSLFSVVAWGLLEPSKEFPWFLIVMGVYLLIWEIVYFKETADLETEPENRSKNYFYLHTSVAATFNMVLFLLWYFNSVHHPWLFFVLGLSGVALTIHFTAVYLDLRQILLLPQIMLFVVINGMNVGIWYFNGQSEDMWFMWPLCIWGAVILIESVIFGIVKLFQIVQRKKAENIHSYQSNKSRRANEAHNSNNTLTTNLLAPPVIETKFISYGSVSANTSDSDLSNVDIYLNPSYYNSINALVPSNGDRHSSTPDLGRTRSASSASDKKRAMTGLTKFWSSNNGQLLAPVEMKPKPAGYSHRSLNGHQMPDVTAQAARNATRATGAMTPPPAGHAKNAVMPILITPEITTFVTPQVQHTTAWPIQRPKSEGDLTTVTQSNSVYNIDVGHGDDAESAVTRLLIEHQNSKAYDSKFFNSVNIV